MGKVASLSSISCWDQFTT